MTKKEFRDLVEISWENCIGGEEFLIEIELGHFQDWHRIPMAEWDNDVRDNKRQELIDISYPKLCEYLEEQDQS